MRRLYTHITSDEAVCGGKVRIELRPTGAVCARSCMRTYSALIFDAYALTVDVCSALSCACYMFWKCQINVYYLLLGFAFRISN